MRLKAPVTVSALVLAGLVTAGSTSSGVLGGPDPRTPAPFLRSAEETIVAAQAGEYQLTSSVGLVPASPKPSRSLRTASPLGPVTEVGAAPFAGSMPLRDVALPSALGALGIPEIMLAAYRNAELAMAASTPNCGITWNLLAGIGRIESGHANGGKTDAAGTTATAIAGPALDGTLPGNEIIKHADGSAVRAVGPMQFLPTTWKAYEADGNADGVADPNNVFDAALGAAKYLCSGGLNLRDPAQELKAVLRYNNSMSYAANVLSWSAAYRTGGVPAAGPAPVDLIPPGTSSIDMSSLVDSAVPALDPKTGEPTTTTPPTTTTTPPPLIPGLPALPCIFFCPPVPAPTSPQQELLGPSTPPNPDAAAAPQTPQAPPPAPAPAPLPFPEIVLPVIPPLLPPPPPGPGPAAMPAPAPAFLLVPPPPPVG